ncbi:MFS general substrate transporter [Microthyrium microscopicum]|uniref:MFS general substrate transporter n=1 Tax=Microthyrium microscopicum TaxID=703497 RepID=A0A6A6UKA3_9PEZI|nr:MFS general substrate transporter [Microthyrium microscopicum]
MPIGREVLFVFIIVFSHFMTQAAFSQAMGPIDIIAKSFPLVGGRNDHGAWSIAGYALTSGTFILIAGRLGDIIGHKRIFSIGYGWFAIWSALTGFSVYAHSLILYDICRAMQGIGPALLVPNGLALLAGAYPPGMKKNLLFSLFGWMAPAGFVSGAAFGGLFAQKLWWPWIFWSFAGGCLTLFIASFFIIPENVTMRPEKAPSFDWAGCVTGVAGLVFINVAVTNGPLYGWGTPHVYFLAIIGLFFMLAFAWIEKRAKNPLLPVRDLNSTVAYILACVALGWGAFGIWLFYTFRFLQQVRHATPLMVAAQYAPAPISGLIAAGMTGFLLSHVPVSLVNLLSMIAFFSGVIIATFLPVHQSYWHQMFVSIVVMPFGMDMSFPAATIVLSNHMSPENQGMAASLVVTTVNYSISIALGIAGTVEMVMMKKGHGFDTMVHSLKGGYWAGVCMAGAGILLGMVFFIRTLRKEGWKLLDE